MTSFSGSLLVAAPILIEPTFRQTVILLLEHDQEDGALGVVLNRPMGVPTGEPLPGWDPLSAAPGVLFDGGPVRPEAAIGLGRVRDDAGEQPDDVVVGPVAVIDLDEDPTLAAARWEAVRVFVGYSGWGPGQLEDELSEGAWFLLDAEPSDAFADDPANLWRSVMARQSEPLRQLRHYPDDPELN